MGKKRLEKVKGEGYRARIEQAVLDFDDRKNDVATFKIRQKYFKNRWARELGLNPNPAIITQPEVIEKILAHPQISLEWKLSDPRNLEMLRKEGKRETFINSLTDEERDIYFNHPEGYQELEKPITKQLGRSAKRLVKRIVKKGEDDAIEEFIDGKGEQPDTDGEGDDSDDETT